MTKYSAKYVEQNAIECCECGKRIWREMAILVEGIQVCSDACATQLAGTLQWMNEKVGA